MRKKSSLLVLSSALLLVAVFSLPQAAHSKTYPSDTVKAKGGDIKITPVNHATLVLEHAGKVIVADPTGGNGGVKVDAADLPKADVILVTDIHGDHMNRESIDKVKKASTVVVAPASVAKTITEAQVINNGEKKEIAGVSIEGVPMYNLVRGPEAGKLFHDKGRGDGYILTIGGKRIYISGDTECTPEMKALKNIDIAFVSMNLPYTMGTAEAAECVKAFRPKIVYPYHDNGQKPEEFADALKGEKGIEVRVRDWYSK